jgi:hypothetical protein
MVCCLTWSFRPCAAAWCGVLQELERASTGKPQQTNQASSVKPREIYESEITEALVTAVLDGSAGVGVGPDEWLTIAAREERGRPAVHAGWDTGGSRSRR